MRAASSRSATRAHCALLGSAALGNSTGSVGAECTAAQPDTRHQGQMWCSTPHRQLTPRALTDAVMRRKDAGGGGA